MFFIDHVQIYPKGNCKGKEMCEFAQAYDHILVQDRCAMDTLKCKFEEEVNKLNKKFHQQTALTFCEHLEMAFGGMWSIKVNNDDYNHVCFVSYSKVRGHYSPSEGLHQPEQKGGE